MLKSFVRPCVLLAALLLGSVAHAAYPDKPIRFIVPFAAGGTTDAMTRRLTDELALRLKQTVIVESKPGGAGSIGASYVANAPADGYTVLFTSTSIVQAPLLLKNPPFDPLKDFTPVAMVCVSPVVLAASMQTESKNMKELIEHLRKRPNASYASSGHGTTSNIYSEELKRQFKLDVAHVPYSGDAKSTLDLMSDRVQFFISTPAGLAPLAEQGRVRLLGVSGKERLKFLPEVPTMAEQGITGFDVVGWFGVFLPAKTPKEVVDLLRREITAIVTGPAYTQYLSTIRTLPPTGGDFASEVAKTRAGWEALIKANGIRIE